MCLVESHVSASILSVLCSHESYFFCEMQWNRSVITWPVLNSNWSSSCHLLVQHFASRVRLVLQFHSSTSIVPCREGH
jgi:hypothetical protein